jgi:SAM-dependent methyltransferase
MGFTKDDIVKLYKSEADKHRDADTSTIQDARTRRLEMDALFSNLRDGLRVLEVGCGNGYVAEAAVQRFNIDLDAFDFSHDMIAIAKTRPIQNAKGRVSFSQGDILTLNACNRYDLVFSERCIQNLPTWEEQQIGLRNIASALKSGGLYIMLESFWTGLNNLNAARRELGLEDIPESWHNRFFVEDETKQFLSSVGCRYVDQNCFLSGYYFGSRVLLPALLPKDKPVTSKSILNDYFCAFPPAGDFCPMKILRFVKQ